MKPLNFTLRQHTPMLHFQASQEGATLRASDVKPRFDRWLIKEVWDDNFDECCSYLVGYSDKFSEKEMDNFRQKFDGGYRALNYKMRIVALSEDAPRPTHRENRKGTMVSYYPMYFGDQREAISRNCRVEFTFTGCRRELKEAIIDNFAIFINSHNFGIRSSKGYGSFTVASCSEKDFPKIFPEIYVELDNGSWKDVENQIDLFYKTIRSGINLTQKIRRDDGKYMKGPDGKVLRKGYYFKSMLYSYVEKKYNGACWDKKIIKNHFLKAKQSVIDIKKDYRDCLGLSASESWLDYKITITKSVKDIDRFASPIVFKPVTNGAKWKVYIILNKIPEKYQGEVKVSATQMKEKPVDTRLITDYQTTPLTGMYLCNDFSLEKYFDYLFKECPAGMKKNSWLNANDISERFVKYDETEYQKKHMEDIVDFYRKLRAFYANKS